MTPDEGPLTIADAVAHVENQINAAPATGEPAETATEEHEEENSEEVPTSSNAEGPEAVTDGDAEEESEAPEGEEPEQAPLEPPKFWDADAKKRFGDLPRDLQEIVLAKEAERDKATSKTIEETALKRKAADAEASKFASYVAGLDKLLPQVQEAFKGKWPEDIDWNKVAEEQGAENAFKLKNDFDRDQKVLQQLQAAKDDADRTQTERFIADRNEKFKTVIPEFADPKTGPDEQLKVVKYLTGLGIDQKVIIQRASAEELSVARKAMLWDEAQTKAKQLASKKTAAPPSKTVVRPTATVSAASPQSATLKAAKKSFDTNPSIANAVEVAKRLAG